MNPVIQRELREQARTPALYRMRLAAAAVLLATLAWTSLSLSGLPQAATGFGPFTPGGVSEGSFLFLRLHQALMLTILALTPALTADAIARERREATLGLLGLTPLRPLAVALGKSAANALRALTLWLAAVPILTVPLLLGGVSAVEVVSVVTFQLTTLALGLAAGLAASAVAVQFKRALALAYVLAAGLLLGAFWLNAKLVPWAMVAARAGGVARPGGMLWLSGSPELVFGWSSFGGLAPSLAVVLGRNGSAGAQGLLAWLLGLGVFVLAAGLIAGLALGFAAWRVGRAWHEEPPRPGTLELQRRFTRPILFAGWIHARQQQRLTRNPLLWLQHRTVAAALTRWGWSGVVLAVWIADLGGGFFGPSLLLAPLALLGGMVFSAAGGFRAERENGTLELLLVTPLRPGQLLQSRLAAHVREFLLPVLLQVALTWYATGLWRRGLGDSSRFNWWLLSSLLLLPMIGLWRGLAARSFVTAVLGTALWGLLIPALLSMVLMALANPLFFEGPALLGRGGVNFFLATRLEWGVLPAAIQLAVGGWAATRVWRELATRQFALGTVGRN